MKKVNLSYKKSLLREQYHKIRSKLPLKRKNQAASKVYQVLKKVLGPYDRILSFMSLPEEIDLISLNKFLSNERKLCLPKIEGISIQTFLIEEITSQISIYQWGLSEPNCYANPISTEEIDCILVPGIVFDEKKYRIGYGKGYYDRFLKEVNCLKFGIGFKEQYSDKALPIEKHDLPVDALFLF